MSRNRELLIDRLDRQGLTLSRPQRDAVLDAMEGAVHRRTEECAKLTEDGYGDYPTVVSHVLQRRAELIRELNNV